MVRWICGVSLIALVSGCASFSPPVRVEATPAALELLAGDWSGDYVGDDPQARRGTIVFKLVWGEDHAHGDVIMVPAGSTRAYERYHGDQPPMPEPEGSRSQVLTIRFVRATDGPFITGQLDPYWDPDRRSRAFTSFRGTIGDGMISGTFETRFADAGAPEATTGRWKVVRQRPRPRR
jgi:hypothetical protein